MSGSTIDAPPIDLYPSYPTAGRHMADTPAVGPLPTPRLIVGLLGPGRGHRVLPRTASPAGTGAANQLPRLSMNLAGLGDARAALPSSASRVRPRCRAR